MRKNASKIIIYAFTALLLLLAPLSLFGTLTKDTVLKIAFVDSGIGGLLFAYDAYQESVHDLEALESAYKLDIQFVHIGDSLNAPYGLKEVSDIRRLTKGLIEMSYDDLNAQQTIVACNTASSVMDGFFQQELAARYPDKSLRSILYESAKALYQSAELVNGEIHIAVFSTVATEKSDRYPQLLKSIHAAENPEASLHIYTYAPKYWVNEIEANGKSAALKAMLQQDLQDFSSRYDDISSISALGLFCTHFALLEADIAAYFFEQYQQQPALVSQGALFAEGIRRYVQLSIQNRNIKKRVFKKAARLDISSYITGDNAELMYDTMLKVDPTLDSKLFVNSVSAASRY